MTKRDFLSTTLSPARLEAIKRLSAKAPIHVFHPVEAEMQAVQQDCAFAYQMARDLYAAGKYAKDWQRYAQKRNEDLRMLRMRLDIHTGMCVPLEKKEDPHHSWVKSGIEDAIAVFLSTVDDAIQRYAEEEK
jgi:hypothetical protein